MFWCTHFVQLFIPQTHKLPFIPLHTTPPGLVHSRMDVDSCHPQWAAQPAASPPRKAPGSIKIIILCVCQERQGCDEGSSYCCVNAAEKDIYFHSQLTPGFQPLREYSWIQMLLKQRFGTCNIYVAADTTKCKFQNICIPLTNYILHKIIPGKISARSKCNKESKAQPYPCSLWTFNYL